MNFKHFVCIASSLPIALYIPIANANQQTLSYPNGEACSRYSSTPFCKELIRLFNDFQTARTCQTSILNQIFTPPKDLNPKTCYSGTIAEYIQLLNKDSPETVLLPLGFPQGAITDFDKAIEINSNNLTTRSSYKYRGVSKGLVGDAKGACADWKEASSLGDKDAAQLVRDACQ